MGHNLIGRVMKSEVGNPTHPHLLTTVILVEPARGQKVPYLDIETGKNFGVSAPVKMSLRGRHIIGGQTISADYACHTGVLWVQHYNILDEKGNVIHSDFPEIS